MANNGKQTGKTGMNSTKKTPSSSTAKKKATVPDIGKTISKQVAPKPDNSYKKEEHENKTVAVRQKLAIIFFAVALVLLFVAVVKGESAWLVMHNFSFKLFGGCMYALPFIFGYLSFDYAKNKSIGSVSANLAGCGAAVVIAESLVHIIGKSGTFSDSGEKYLSAVTTTQQISDVWNSFEPQKTGGVIGALFGGLLSRFLGQTGSIIILIIVFIVVVMFVTNLTLGGVFNTVVAKPAKKVNEITNERITKRAEDREQREIERAEIREKKKFNPPEQSSMPDKSKLDIDMNGDFDSSFVRDESTYKIRKNGNEPMSIPVVDIDLPQPAEAVLPEIKKSPRKSKKNNEENKQTEFENTIGKENIEVNKNEDYIAPPIDCLELREPGNVGDSAEEKDIIADKLIATLESFKVKARVVNICSGPSVTRYEIEPDIGVKISSITRLADDIALRLASSGVRIAAIPNKTAIGIEVPNRQRLTVGMRECIDTEIFKKSKSKLNVALGKDIAGNIIYADLSKMPHLLIAGTTGSGKSVCLNTMILSILYNASPDEVKLVMIDPKQVEFTVYNGIAHLEVPVVSNPRKAAGALSWAVSEMEKRYKQFSENNVRDINGFNKLAENSDTLHKMHRVVIFIDELADLMMVAPTEVEDSICRLAQMARAAGMHLVVATQRPSVNIITGVIKANIPSRISLSVSSQVDSRTILDSAGAEKLLGNGDMLFLPVGASKPQRIQGCFISDEEVEKVVDHIKQNTTASYNDDVMQEIENLAKATEQGKKRGSLSSDDIQENDGPSEDVIKALEVLIKAGKASTTFLQNKLGWGYPKAARIMNELEERGYIAQKEGNKERKVLITLQQLYEMNNSSDGMPNVLTTDNAIDEEDTYTNYDDILGLDEEEIQSYEEDDDFKYVPFDDSED